VKKLPFAEFLDPVCLFATRDKRARRCHDFLPFTLISAHLVAQPANFDYHAMSLM